MICRQCGNEVRDGAKFCINCGATFDAEPMMSAPAYGGKKSGSKKLLFRILALVMLVVFIASGVLGFLRLTNIEGRWKVYDFVMKQGDKSYTFEELKEKLKKTGGDAAYEEWEESFQNSYIDITKTDMVFISGEEEMELAYKKKSSSLIIEDGKEEGKIGYKWRFLNLTLVFDADDLKGAPGIDKLTVELKREWTTGFIVEMAIYAGVMIATLVLAFVFFFKSKKQVQELENYATAFSEVSYTADIAEAVVEETVLCKACGQAVRAGMKFCVYCGAPMTVTEPSMEPELVAEVIEVAPAESEIPEGVLIKDDESAPTDAAPMDGVLCTVCGKAVNTGTKFCVYCGAPMQAAETVSVPDIAPAEEHKSEKMSEPETGSRLIINMRKPKSSADAPKSDRFKPAGDL